MRWRGYAAVLAASSQHRDPAGVAARDRYHRRSVAEPARRLGRSHALEPDQGEDASAGRRQRVRGKLYPLRRSRACHGRGDERHRAAWRLHPLWRHVPYLCRLQPPRHPAGRADGRSRHLCDDARFHRPRRRRPDPSAGRASCGVAGDPEPVGVSPRRRHRDRGSLGLRVARQRQPVGAVPVAAGAAGLS